MTRETAATKALRLLSEARVSILSVHRRRVFASVRGDEQSYDVTYTHGRWHCPCAARGPCSHLIAVRSVVDTARLGGGPDE